MVEDDLDTYTCSVRGPQTQSRDWEIILYSPPLKSKLSIITWWTGAESPEHPCSSGTSVIWMKKLPMYITQLFLLSKLEIIGLDLDTSDQTRGTVNDAFYHAGGSYTNIYHPLTKVSGKYQDIYQMYWWGHPVGRFQQSMGFSAVVLTHTIDGMVSILAGQMKQFGRISFPESFTQQSWTCWAEYIMLGDKRLLRR